MPDFNPGWISVILLLAGNLIAGIIYLSKQDSLLKRHTELHGEHQERLDQHQRELSSHDRILAVHNDRFDRG
jgi:hypothetical protein